MLLDQQDESRDMASETVVSDEEVDAMLGSLQHEETEDDGTQLKEENTSESESEREPVPNKPRSNGRHKLWSLDKLMPPPPPHFDFGTPSSDSEGEESKYRTIHRGKENRATTVVKDRTKSCLPLQVASSQKQFHPTSAGGVPTPFLQAALINKNDLRERSSRLGRPPSSRRVDEREQSPTRTPRRAMQGRTLST